VLTVFRRKKVLQ